MPNGTGNDDVSAREREPYNWIETFYFGIYDKYIVGMHHSFIKRTLLSNVSFYSDHIFVSAKQPNERRHGNLVYKIILTMVVVVVRACQCEYMLK